MQRACGYSLIIDKDRSELFSRYTSTDYFAEPVNEFNHSKKLPLICFIQSGKGKITHVANGRRGARAGTGLSRLNLSNIIEIQNPISIKSILKHVPNKSARWIKHRLLTGGLFTQKSFSSLVDAILTISPELKETLYRYSEMRESKIQRLKDTERIALAYQKEAVATAMSMANISLEPLQDWQPPDTGSPQSFLDGLEKARLREDPMVVNDMMNFPGFQQVKTYPYNAVLFENEDVRLTVIVANRQPLEKQLGTDLIYYNESYKSFIMVQYKAMEEDNTIEDEEASHHKYVYRLPNKQLAEEIERIDTVLHSLRDVITTTTKPGYRININPFFIKLCPRVAFNPDKSGMIEGMYFPLDYFKLFEADDTMVGPRGGKIITYDNVGRHMTNTEFKAFVAKGWIGSPPEHSDILGQVIRDTIEKGNALAIAFRSVKLEKTEPSEAPASYLSDKEIQ